MHTNTALKKAECGYLVASHKAQVPEGFAALSDLCGSLVCNVFTPASVYSLYGAAVLAYGYQSCRQREERRDMGKQKTEKVLAWKTFLMQMWQHHSPSRDAHKFVMKPGQLIWLAVTQF